MASPPPYSSPSSPRHDESGSDGFRSAAQVRLPSSLSDQPSSTASSAATLPGYPSPPSSYAKDTPSSSKYEIRSSIGSSLASTEAIRRLRDAEEELKRLRELNSRLKAEGAAASGLSPTRIKQLENDARASSADAPGRANSGLFKQVCSTDLLFLIDTTASMSGHINAAKQQVKSIVSDISIQFLGEADIRIAVVVSVFYQPRLIEANSFRVIKITKTVPIFSSSTSPMQLIVSATSSTAFVLQVEETRQRIC
jgi:hypothetical protein